MARQLKRIEGERNGTGLKKGEQREGSRREVEGRRIHEAEKEEGLPPKQRKERSS